MPAIEGFTIRLVRLLARGVLPAVAGGYIRLNAGDAGKEREHATRLLFGAGGQHTVFLGRVQVEQRRALGSHALFHLRALEIEL